MRTHIQARRVTVLQRQGRRFTLRSFIILRTAEYTVMRDAAGVTIPLTRHAFAVLPLGAPA